MEALSLMVESVALTDCQSKPLRSGAKLWRRRTIFCAVGLTGLNERESQVPSPFQKATPSKYAYEVTPGTWSFPLTCCFRLK